MDVKLEIPFAQLLRIIQQLTPIQRKKVQALLEKDGDQLRDPSPGQVQEPFAELWGIWADRDIDLKKIRAKAWRRY